MIRSTQSYASVPPFGTPIEELANGPALDEQRMREQCARDGFVDVFDDAGVWAARLTYRDEIKSWTGEDKAHFIPLTRGTYEKASRLALRRCACRTRVEAKGIR